MREQQGMSAEAVPVRLCCFQRHFGPQCPDGRVMCQLCYDRFDPEELEVDPEDGKRWNVCKPCANHDRAMVAARDRIGTPKEAS